MTRQEILRRLAPLKPVWAVVERTSTVFGFVSGVVGVFALIWPAPVIDALEAYEARFRAAEETVAQIADDTTVIRDDTGAIREDMAAARDETARLVAALPGGVSLSEVFQSQTCADTPDSGDYTTILAVNEEDTFFAHAFFRVVGEDGAFLVDEPDTFWNAGSEFMVHVEGRQRPARICFGARQDDGSILAGEAVVMGWRETAGNCDEYPEYGYRLFIPGLRRLAPEEMTLCGLDFAAH